MNYLAITNNILHQNTNSLKIPHTEVQQRGTILLANTSNLYDHDTSLELCENYL